jgi:hypothetical protein
MPARAPIDRLRGISARLLERGDADGVWFASCLAELQAGARHGLTLADAFGFRLAPGAKPWWVIEASTARDALLREIAAHYFSGLSARAAAEAIVKTVARYEAGDWRHHRKFIDKPTLHGIRADLFRLLKIGAPLSVATVRRALVARKIPLLMSHDQEQAAARRTHDSDCDETEKGSQRNRAAPVGG